MKKVDRNEPCPCGSGNKYKKCCLGEEPAPHARGLAAEAIADISEEFKGRRFESLEEANAAARDWRFPRCWTRTRLTHILVHATR